MPEKVDLRVQKTYKALCDTFTKLLSEKRFENITVNELCDVAMVRRATFYNHFSDKYDFFAFFIRQIRKQFLSDADAIDAMSEPYEYDLYLFRQTAAFLREHQHLVNSCMKSALFPVLLQILFDEIYSSILENLQKNTSISADDAPIQATFVAGGTIQTLYYWLKNKNTITEEQVIAQFGAMMKSLMHPAP